MSVEPGETAAVSSAPSTVHAVYPTAPDEVGTDPTIAPPEIVDALEAAENLPPAERAAALEAIHAELVARLGDVRGA